MRLKDKIALVTGASRGIGRGIALRLAEEGAALVVNYPDEGQQDNAEAVVAEILQRGCPAIALRADVSKAAEVQAMVAETVRSFGALHILVNNAGICPFVDFFDLTEEIWNSTQDVNLKGAFLCSQAAARVMVDRKIPGRIISISSISAIVGGSMQVHYCPTKAGVVALMNSLAIVLGPYGITCNSVLPGFIATDLNRFVWETPESHDYWANRAPVRRLGQPTDIAAAVAFLAGDDTGFITGSTLLVDGGLFVNLQ